MGAEARQTSVPSSSAKKAHSKKPATRAAPPQKKKAPAPKPKPAAKKAHAASKPPSPPLSTEVPVIPPIQVRPGDSRRHVLSLSFLRDGDEFFARMETDTGQITELKNRSLDQLLTLVASELEDLLE